MHVVGGGAIPSMYLVVPLFYPRRIERNSGSGGGGVVAGEDEEGLSCHLV